MKDSPAVNNILRTAYNVYAVPSLIVDWNWNRYTTPTADNTPSDDTDGFDIEIFPIESIFNPIRPHSKGIAKALVGQAIVSQGYSAPHQPRFYVANQSDKYQYWTSPYPTDNTATFPLHTDGITTVRPSVYYPTPLKSNKIVIRIENTWASPNSYNVLIQSTVNGAWTAIAGNSPAIDNATGILTLYWNGTAWTTTRPTNMVKITDSSIPQIAGIQIRVNTMKNGYTEDGSVTTYKASKTGTVTNTDGKASNFNLIAIEAHYEEDMTDRLISSSDSLTMQDESNIYPIGTITSNTSTVTLSDDDHTLFLNSADVNTVYSTLLDENAEMTLSYVYMDSDGNVIDTIQDFNMYTGQWQAQDDGTVQVELSDYSKFLDQIKPNKLMYQNKSVNQIVWSILDSVGFNNYNIALDPNDNLVDHEIPVFWTVGDDSVWAVLQSIAEATQTAIYFDSFGVLQVRTRDAAFRAASDADWHLLAEPDGDGNLPDIISLTPTGDTQGNTIDVVYKNTTWKTTSGGVAAMDSVWAPDGDTVVRSAPLVRNISSSSQFIYLSKADVQVWPYASKVQIDGEILEYSGKQYCYYTGTNGNTKNWRVVTSAAEMNKYKNQTPVAYRYKNFLTGGLKITGRGVWNSDERDHTTDTSGWNPKMSLNKGATIVQNPRGFSHQALESTVTINTPASMKDANDIFWVNYGQPTDTGYFEYGTRFKFNSDSGSSTYRAGMGILQQGGNNEDGYYIEFTLSNKLTAKDRKTTNEVSIWARSSGKWINISKGSPVAMAKSIWYDVDIYINKSGSNHVISVWLNGTKYAEGTTNSATKQSDSGRFSLYARGSTNITFEYAYAIARTVAEPEDSFGFYDLEYGGIRGGQWEREHVWNLRTRWKKIKKKHWTKETYKHNQYVFDEFGPYVHEVRHFKVNFDPSPVNYSYLFSTNTGEAACIEYNSNPFGAEFYVTNTARINAVVAGDDSSVGGTSNPVTQQFMVLGQDLVIADDQKVTITNDESVRRHGEVDAELTSDWIQSKDMATDISDWITAHWGTNGVDELSVTIFGNPLIEICDVVDILYSRLGMTNPSNHRYFVMSISNSFDTGLSTTLTLRRITN